VRVEVLSRLRCPACRSRRLASREFLREGDELLEGVVWCEDCRSWFPVEDGFLDFLTGPLAYAEERSLFWKRRAADLTALALSHSPADGVKSESAAGAAAQAVQQQKHFDWYASNKEQRYSDYEATPFWRAADRIAFEPWKAELRERTRPDQWLLDVGCAQGRSTFHMMDLDLNVVGFDVSRECVREAARRYRERHYKARASFIAADGSAFPLLDATVDYVLVYGVLHHLADPGGTCREIGRVLKPAGVYFGQENNDSAFRALFELAQKLWPIWHEEAGPEATISSDRVTGWLKAGGFRVSARTSVFLPPHVINWTNEDTGFRILDSLDRVMARMPWLRANGGLVIFEARRG
jgi:ubiquinone/menaquinone biosynthesis C-methylase UbiE/uncharacterized protein YbaR (Trm112 family)